MDLSTNKLLMVVGANGSGKTTIIDAIIWAIFDETSKGLGGDAVVNNIVGKNCYVKLVFEKDGVEYEIHNYRKHSKYKNTKILYQNGTQLSTDMDVKATNQIINSIFINKDVFLNTMLFSQYIARSFVNMTHSGQKEILDSILMLDRFDQHHETLTNNTNILKRDLDNIQYKIEGIDGKIELHNNNINSENDKLKTNLLYNEGMYKNLNRDKTVLKCHIENLITDLDINKLTELQAKIKDIESKEVQLKTQIESLQTSYQLHLESIKNTATLEYKDMEAELNNSFSDEILALNNDITNKTSELSTIENETAKTINTIISHINNLHTEITDITNKINKIKENNIKQETDKYTLNLNTVNNELHELESKFLRHDSTISNINTNMAAIDTQIQSYEQSKALNKCNTCNQPLNDNIQSINDTITRLQNDKVNLESNLINESELRSICFQQKSTKEQEKVNIIENFNKFIENIETGANNKIQELTTPKIEEIAKLNGDITGFKSTLTLSTETLKNKLDQLKIQLDTKGDHIKNEITKLKTKFNTDFQAKVAEFKGGHISSIQAYEQQIHQCEIDKSNINIDLRSLNERQDTINSKNEELSDITKKMEVITSTTLAVKKNTKEFIKTTKDNIKILGAEKANLYTAVEAVNEELEIVKFWKKAFGDVGIKSVLMDESIPILNKKARELSEFIGVLRVTFSSQKTLKSGKSNNKFSINVVHNTKLSEYADLSAGETKLANIIILLCIRYLLEYMSGYKTNILLLDELLDSLDEENSSIVVSIFEMLSKDYLVLLITHTQKEWIQADEELRM
jgi:DNA repair exonuclease SbcCD ATPase subunit